MKDREKYKKEIKQLNQQSLLSKARASVLFFLKAHISNTILGSQKINLLVLPIYKQSLCKTERSIFCHGSTEHRII